MSRENCMMREIIGDEVYCGYYDVGCAICDENQNCPDEEDEIFEYPDDYDPYGNYE